MCEMWKGENGREMVKTGVCEEVGNVVPSEAEGARGGGGGEGTDHGAVSIEQVEGETKDHSSSTHAFGF